ncbi:hypothetical protein BURPSS13_N0098 [Burkholderia pseudomallei S13]|nr:hypothetical protein BURPSS13_N0098 [Burkholderia pseudomallei S13]
MECGRAPERTRGEPVTQGMCQMRAGARARARRRGFGRGGAAFSAHATHACAHRVVRRGAAPRARMLHGCASRAACLHSQGEFHRCGALRTAPVSAHRAAFQTSFDRSPRSLP